MSLAEDVAALQTRLAEAQRASARAEGARDNAQAVLNTARAQMKEQFGVDNPEQAEELLERLREELSRLVSAISARLDEIGV